MDLEYRDRIDSLASGILSALGEKAPILNIDSIVEKLGGRVEIDTDSSFRFDGKITADREGNGFCITVPKWQNKGRKNFTIAHELGHVFLHMGYLINDELWNSMKGKTYYRKGNSSEEQVANEFAAAFMMPKEAFIDEIEKNIQDGEVDISAVAKHFHVSVDAAAYRGKRLGLLQW